MHIASHYQKGFAHTSQLVTAHRNLRVVASLPQVMLWSCYQHSIWKLSLTLASHFDELIWRVWDAMITNIFLLGRNMLPCIKSKYHTASMLWIYTRILNGNHTQDCVTKYGNWFKNAHILVVIRKHLSNQTSKKTLLRHFWTCYWDSF